MFLASGLRPGSATTMIERVISTILKGSAGKDISFVFAHTIDSRLRGELTNKVLLTSTNLEAGESHNARRNSERTERECKTNTSRRPQYTLHQKHHWNCIDREVASQVEGKVQDERLWRVENRARALFLRPLHGHRCAAEEGIVEEDSQVARNDKSRDTEEHLAQSRVTGEVEECPVESQHAEFGEAHSDIVEVVRGE